MLDFPFWPDKRLPAILPQKEKARWRLPRQRADEC
jgi:hypothetical protein